MSKNNHLKNVEYIDTQQAEQSMFSKISSKAVAIATAVSAYAVSTVSSAAIDFSSAKTEVLGDIDSAESFGVEIGLAILGFIAVISVIRHARGAVK